MAAPPPPRLFCLRTVPARHDCLAVGVCGLNFYQRLPGGVGRGGGGWYVCRGSLICAGGLGINSGALLRQPAWYILIDRRQTGGRNKMTETERFFFPPAPADRRGRGECKGAENKPGLIR